MNIYLVKKTDPANAGFLHNHCSTANAIQVRRVALLAVALGTTAILATGCSSTGTGFSANLISPVLTNRQATNFEDGNWYQPSRGPVFDSDLFGS
jgi:hypothetical protein